MTIENTDLLLINNGTSSETITFAQLKDGTVLNDSDLFLVNDGTKTETIQWSELKDEIGPSAPVYPEPDEITATPNFQGGTGTQLDPYILQTVDVRPGGATGLSVETITIDVAGAVENQPVIWTNNSDQQLTGTRFDQPSGIVGADGTWSGRLVYNDDPDTTVDTDYVGDLQIGDVYFRWTVEQGIDATRPIDPSPSEVTAVPDFLGGTGTEADPYLLRTVDAAPAGSNAQTVETITVAESGAQQGDLVRWIDNSTFTTTRAAGARFTQPEGVVQANGLWEGRLVYNDTPDTAVDQSYTGDLQIGTTYLRWVVDQRVLDTVPPAIASVSLVESNPDADPRFTDQEFVATVNMAEEGVPESTKTIDAHVKGEIKTRVQFKEPLESFENQAGETWSDALTSSVGSFSSPATNAFDGDFNTRCIAATSSTGASAVLTWTLTQAAADLLNTSTGLQWYQVKGDATSSGSSCAVYRNTIDPANLLASAAANNVFPLNLYGGGRISDWVAGDKLISTGWNGQGGGDLLYGISVDNNLMKDGEPEVKTLNFAGGTDMTSLEAGDTVTQSAVVFEEPLQNYTSQQTPVYADKNRFTHVAGSGGNGFNFGYQDGNIAKGFDGIVGNNTGGFLQGQYPNVNPNTEKWWYTFPTPIVSPGKVEVFWQVSTDNSKQHYLIINEATTSVDMTAWANNLGQGSNAKGWQDITPYINDAGGTLRSLGMQTRTVNQPTRGENWSAIRVDGKILVSDVTESSLVFDSGAQMSRLSVGDEVSQPSSQFSADLESSLAGTQPTYDGIQIISATAGFLTGGKNTPFNGNVNDFTQISGQGSGNTITWDMLELANQGFDCRGKELEIYMGSNASNATDMRCQFWDKEFNAQILPWVTLPLNNAYVSMGVVPEDANIGNLRFYPNNVSNRATCYHIKIGGIHVYNSGPYYPALTFPVGTEMGGLAAGDEIEQGTSGLPATTWSNFLSAPSGVTSPENAFDGTANRATATGGQEVITFTLPKAITGEISFVTGLGSTSHDVYVNGAFNQTITSYGSGWVIYNVTNASSIGIKCNSQQTGIAGIKLDSVDFIDDQEMPNPAGDTKGTVGTITNTTVQLTNSSGAWTNGETVTGPVKQPKGTVGSIAGTTVDLERGTDTGGWVNGVNVTGGAGIVPSGTVGSVDEAGASVTLSSSNDAWVDGVEVTGPLKDKVEANVTKYLKFDNSGNVTELLDAPQDPAYETTDEDPSLTLKFPSTFPSGLAPDDELGAGTTLTVEATASNSAGTSATKSAEVLPDSGAPNPLVGMTTLYDGAGNGNSDLNIVTGVDMINNEALLWIKSRDNGENHMLFDTVRGHQNHLSSNAEGSQTSGSPLQSFNDNGFTVTWSAGIWTAKQYAAWTFVAQEEYFDVVQQTIGTGATVVNHQLNRPPRFIIGKPLNSNDGWYCHHVGIPYSQYLRLDQANAAQNVAVYSLVDSSQFTVNNQNVTGVEGDWIFYLFADNPDKGIKCGVYEGNGSTTGPIVTTGFEPQWVLIKRTEGGGTMNWSIFDSARGFSSGLGVSDGKLLLANTTANEYDDKTIIPLSDGFQIADNGGTINGDGQNHIYIAIAKPSTRSMTQEEFNEQRLKFETYNHRMHVNCVEKVEEARDGLIQYLAAQGYSLEDILAYI